MSDVSCLLTLSGSGAQNITHAGGSGNVTGTNTTDYSITDYSYVDSDITVVSASC